MQNTSPKFGLLLKTPQRMPINREFSNIYIFHLGVQYHRQEALQDITCTIKAGRLTGIFGPNGAGKSTLIKAILGLVPMSMGSVVYDGRPLVDQLEKVAYVPQRSQIDWNYPATVWDVVMMGRVKKTGWFRSFSNMSRQIAMTALERVEMVKYINRPIGELSGGQQQRVFLARALTQEPEIFCFDEPFVGIDHKTQGVLFNIFQEITARGKIVLVVNHDLGESINNFDDLILLNCQLIASGPRLSVLTETNLQRAYFTM